MAEERPSKRIRLVNYSDSDEEEETEPAKASTQDKGKQREDEVAVRADAGSTQSTSAAVAAVTVTAAKSSSPPLKHKMSIALQDMYAYHNPWRGVNDPALHGGRRKATQIPRGHWPGFVHLEWRPTIPEADLLQALVDQLKWPIPPERKAMVEARVYDCSVVQPLHISLSRTLAVPQDREDEFLEVLRRGIWNLHLGPIQVTPTELTWFENEDGTLHFLVFTVACEDEVLRTLLRTVNGLLKQELDVGLEEAEVADWLFHITFAVTKSQQIPTSSGVKITPFEPERRRLREKFGPRPPPGIIATMFGDFAAKSQIKFNGVKVRCGAMLHHIPFDEKEKIPEKSALDKLLRR